MTRSLTFNVAGAAVAALLFSVSSSVAQDQTAPAAPLIVGTWKLNVEKSNARVPPDYIEIRQYSMRPDGFLVGLLITGTPQAYHYLQFVARRDGKDYPEYSDQVVGELIAAGTPTPRTYAEQPIDDYVTEWTDKVNGRVTGHGRKIVSQDRTTLTITIDGAPASRVRVYDRQ
jgi:hypothetical protein